VTLGEVRRKTSAAQSRGYSVEGWKVLDRADGRQGRDALQQAAPRLADMLHLEGIDLLLDLLAGDQAPPGQALARDPLDAAALGGA